MYRAVDAGRSTAASVRFQGAMFLKGPVWGSSSRRWSCPTKPGTAGGRVQSSEAAFGPHLMTGQVRTPKRPRQGSGLWLTARLMPAQTEVEEEAHGWSRSSIIISSSWYWAPTLSVRGLMATVRKPHES